MKTNQDECENCGNPNLSHGGTWEGRHVCWECKHQGFFLADEQLERAEKAESLCGDLRRERDDQCDANAVLREANKNLLAEMRAANERAEQAERERDEARAQAVWAIPLPSHGGGSGFWGCLGPSGMGMCWTDEGARWQVPEDVQDLQPYGTEAEAEAAGRAVPWWEVKA